MNPILPFAKSLADFRISKIRRGYVTLLHVVTWPEATLEESDGVFGGHRNNPFGVVFLAKVVVNSPRLLASLRDQTPVENNLDQRGARLMD